MPLPLPVLSQPCLSAMHKPYRNVCKTPFLTTSLYFVGTPSPSKGTVANPPSSHGLSIIVSSGEAICSPILPFNRERPVSTSYASKIPAIAPKNSANRRFSKTTDIFCGTTSVGFRCARTLSTALRARQAGSKSASLSKQTLAP